MHQQKHTHQTSTHRSLAKSAIATAMTIALGGSLTQVNAALPSGTLLNFDPGVPMVTGCSAGNFTGTSCTIGGTPYTAFEITDMGGSYFLMDQGNGPADKVAISQFAALELGTTQTSSGQHTGLVDGSENPAIDDAWNFFFNAGMHNLSSPISVVSDMGATQTLDFSGWGVNWGSFGPGGTQPTIPMPGTATIVCGSDCSNNDTYNLDMDVHVPVAFASVPYSLHLEGTVSLPGGAPVTNPDSVNTVAGNPVIIDVLANDTVGGEGFNLASVTVVGAATNGTTDDTRPDGTIEYSPTGVFTGMDNFTYTVASNLGPVSAPPADVDVDVQTNVAPVANDDSAATSTAVLENGPLVKNVTQNDTDVNNSPGLPGGIDVATVNITSPPSTGTCTANNNGTITYSQTSPVVEGNFTCNYTVSDIDITGPLQSNAAAFDISISAVNSDWPLALDPNIIPRLDFEKGIPGDPNDTSVPATGGTYFTMQVSAATTIYTIMEQGPSGGIIIGHDQPAGNSHPENPTGDEETSLDLGWSFFSNTGFTYTDNGGITGNPDGTLQFGGATQGEGKYLITWTGIPRIDLGGAPNNFPSDLGFGTIECNPAPCEHESSYALVYEAHVPPGDPSGFGGVPYTLFSEGTVRFLDNQIKASSGTITEQSRLTSDETGVTDPDVELQCVGDCFDYTITGTTEPSVSVYFPLAGGVPKNPVWRILEDGAWRSFDTSGGDTVLSAALPTGDVECPVDGYGPLTTGHQCIELTIADNGVNDLDKTVGIISDPSGMGSGGEAGGGTVFVDNRTSGTSGCTVTSTPVSPLRGGAWWLLAGLAGWMGWNRRKSKQH